ncbi:hypothetical protein JCM1840_007359 [Sporobolomyces johnsonii]
MNGRVLSFSRIDHVLLSARHSSLLRDAQVVYTAPFSDHRPVVATLALPDDGTDPALTPSLPSRSDTMPHINTTIFRDQHYLADFDSFYRRRIEPSQLHFPSLLEWWDQAKVEMASFALRWARLRHRQLRQQAEDLAATITAIENTATRSPSDEEQCLLPRSQTVAHVRLLFKSSKAGADPTNLKYWRPISLRETDYKILIKVLIRASGLEEAALLSLDQEKAYDLVDHEWIVACYEAFGDPLSCASWIVAFQPFLDALDRHRVALTLPSPISSTRPWILTTLAFADDSLVVVESVSRALPALRALSVDWHLATNGRLNADKTQATAIGARAREDDMASSLRWLVDEGFVLWAGFPFSP